MSRRIPLWSVLLVCLGAVTAYAFVTAEPKIQPQIIDLVQDPIPVAQSPGRVRAGALWPQLRLYLKAFGDRLEKPGKERLILSGTLDRSGTPGGAFIATSEFPDRLRLTIQSGAQARTIIYNGQEARGILSTADQDLIETLVNDTAEHFFSAQVQGAPTRHLGDRFRADDGSTANYAGSFHDVFSMVDRVKIGPETRSQPKLYYFNSETHLLDRVKYQISRNGQPVEVETQISGWQQIQDQQMPGRIVRLEDGQQVMSLTIASAAVGPRMNDGIF